MFRFFIALPILAFYVFLSFLIFPIHLLTKRKLGGIVFRHCSAVMLKICGVRCKTEGLENITSDETYLVTANHQSIADIPIIGAILPINVRVLAKKEIFMFPFLGQAMWLYDFIAIDRKNRRSAVKSLEIAEKKMKYCSYLVFPEGTRSRDGHVGRFKSGALILTEKGCKILPVALIGADKILKTGELDVHPGEVRIKIFPSTQIGENETRQELAERLNALISGYVESEKH
ncbi:1-acyl-sn-glycerol-3-phosphate acyltransferase [bacterium]|nr:1-acyl-sn-glycerol-3-phosphate acyltransferase [bacterium]